MLGTILITALMVAAIVVAIGVICILAKMIKNDGGSFSLICGIIALFCLIIILVLGICLIWNWGNPCIIRQYMAGFGLAGIVLVSWSDLLP